MARNRQVPRRRGSAIGVASEVIMREFALRHPQWHQVGSRGILLQRPSCALRTKATTGVIVMLEGGDLPRVADLRAPLLLRSSTRRTIPGPPDRGRVERLPNGLCRWTRVPPLLRRRRCVMPAAAPGVSSQSPWSAGWSSYPPVVPFESSGASPPAQLARPWRQVGIAAPRNADKVPVELEDKIVPAELCLPGQRSWGAIAL